MRKTPRKKTGASLDNVTDIPTTADLQKKLEMIAAVMQKFDLNEISVADIRVWRAEIPKPTPPPQAPAKAKTAEEQAKEDEEILFFSAGGGR